MGVRNIQLERDAVVIASTAVRDSDEILVMTASGIVIRTPVSEIRVIGRGTKGVRIMRLSENDRVVGIAVVPAEDDANGNGPEPGPPGTTGGPGDDSGRLETAPVPEMPGRAEDAVDSGE
jgi:DNA gyrase subunit A